MSTRDDGGPAFPTDHSHFDGCAVPKESGGMTLRDYFIAHAPAEPQSWFEPSMEPRPALPSRDELSDDDRAHYSRYEECEPDDFHDRPALRGWLQRREAALARAEQWDAERKRLRYVQWPAAWADAMLEERVK